MAGTTWKHTERKVAQLLGGRRVGPSGMSTADVTTDWLVAECKHRQTLPAWLKAALVQAVNAADSSQLPICVLHESGQRHTDDLVLMRLGDFIDHFGPLDDGLDGGKTAG